MGGTDVEKEMKQNKPEGVAEDETKNMVIP